MSLKYCVASVYVNIKGISHVAYYAYSNDAYGLRLVNDWDNPNIKWYDTVEQAEANRLNYNDCVVSRIFNNA